MAQGSWLARVVDQWAEAALWFGVFLGNGKGERSEAHYHLLMMGRLQHAVEVSYRRLQRSHAARESGIQPLLTMYLDAHSFLVSAHLYWKTLRKLKKVLRGKEFAAVLREYSQVVQGTEDARHHIEHIDERISKGRGPKYGTRMLADEFRVAMGRFDGSVLQFGDEQFSVDEIRTAVRSAGERVARWTRDACKLDVTVRIGPSGDSPREATTEP